MLIRIQTDALSFNQANEILGSLFSKAFHRTTRINGLRRVHAKETHLHFIALAIEGTEIGDGKAAILAAGLKLSGPLILRRAKVLGEVALPRAVPRDGQVRLLIDKTYKDPKSYFEEGEWERDERLPDGSPLPILGKGSLESAIRMRRHKPIFVVDLAVPRDIEPEVEQLPDVYLYTIDDLKDTIKENLKTRKEAAKQAEEIIDTQVEHFLAWLRAQGATDTIRHLRGEVARMREETLQRALRELRKGKAAEDTLRWLAESLCNKIIHVPSTQIWQAGVNERPDLIAAARAEFQQTSRTLDGRALDLTRDQFIVEMKERGIGTSVHFIPIHHHPYYRETFGWAPGDFPVADEAFETMVSLPLYTRMTDSAVDRVATAVEEIVRGHRT